MASFDERLCLQWNDFKENVSSAFGDLREDKDFTDVTLACEDGQQVEAHKVILSTSSPFFANLLRLNQHAHPLIFMRGLKMEDLTAIVDFLYFGEASVPKENLDSFLSIADELKLVGLSSGEGKENDPIKSSHPEEKEVPPILEVPRTQDEVKLEERGETLLESNQEHLGSVPEKEIDQNNVAVDVAKQLGLIGLSLEKITSKKKNTKRAFLTDKIIKRDQEDPDKLAERIGSMMIPSKNKTPNGKRAHTCKVCGKEAQKSNIKHHIERHHMEGWRKGLKTCELCKVICSNEFMGTHLEFSH